MGVSCSSHPAHVVDRHHQPNSSSRQQSTTQLEDEGYCNVQPQSPLKRVPELAASAPPTDATPIHISVNLEQRPKTAATGPHIRRRRSAPKENNWESVLVAPNNKPSKRSASRESSLQQRRSGSPTLFPDGVPYAPLHLMQRTSVISDQGISSSATTPDHVNHRAQPYTARSSFPGMIRSQESPREGGGGNNRSVTFIIEDDNFHMESRDHELDAFSDY